MIIWTSSDSVVMSSFSFLILLIRILSLCPLVYLTKGLSILLIFLKEPPPGCLIVCIVLVSTWLISDLSLIITCCLLLFGEYSSFCCKLLGVLSSRYCRFLLLFSFKTRYFSFRYLSSPFIFECEIQGLI